MTACEEPYIGEESIMRPPAAKKLRMISAQAMRASSSSPTLKVTQLPSPITGKASPVEGTGLVTSGADWARPSAGRSETAEHGAAAKRWGVLHRTLSSPVG